MQLLKRDASVDTLFADFFASLAMLFMLLINTVSSIDVDPAGQQMNEERIVIDVSAQNRWSWQQHHELTVKEAISLLPKDSIVQLNVASTVDAETLFANFKELHQAGVTYSFNTSEGL